MADTSDVDPQQQIIAARARALTGCLSARSAIDLLADNESFTEYGLLAGRTTSVDDDGPSDGIVGGVCDIGEGAVSLIAIKHVGL